MSQCKRIQSAWTRFWWDSNPDKKSMCWVAWDKLTKPKNDGGLGLRDIEALNDAMLAKSSWRIINNPESLLARVLLSKYCKEDDFLNVEVTSDCSHGWRGLLLGRDVIKEGISNAIGNGEDVNIWEDSWISLDRAERAYGPATKETLDWSVSKLFHEGTTTWNREKVKLVFPEREKEILKLQPSGLGAKDKRFWVHGAGGNYQTKRGHFQAIKEKGENEADTERDQRFDWMKNIWKLDTAPKIHMFLWKAKKKALPVGTNLRERNVIPTSSCPRCGEDEDTVHTLFHCQYAKEIWGLAPFYTQVVTEEWTNIEEALEKAKQLKALPPVGANGETVFASICWNVWLSRNKLIFEKRKLGAWDVCMQGVVDAREWTATQTARKEEEKMLEKEKVEMDMNRDEGEIATTQAFTDAAWDSQTEKAGLGWIIKDREGTLTDSGSKGRNHVRSSLMAEAIACLEALKHLKAINRNKVMVSSDSLNLIRALTKEEYPIEIYGIVSDIKTIAKGFEFLCFSFVPRRYNSEADYLAKMALLLEPTEVDDDVRGDLPV